MKVIVFTDEMKLALAERLVSAGVPISSLPSFLGMSVEKLYYRFRGSRNDKHQEFRRRKSVRRIETALELLERGCPLDVVAYATGVPGSHLLSWFEDEDA